MASFGDIIGIGFRIISHREEIMKLWDKIAPMIRNATDTYADIKALVDKIAPGVLDAAKPSALALGAVVKGGPQNFSVAWLQQSLNTIDNAGLVVDGDYGEATKEAVIAFQQRHSLEVDGWAGAGTSAAILAELDKGDLR
jgi:peptidoglycan hydrolase-like protein with peptidoglycan-binding domain